MIHLYVRNDSVCKRLYRRDDLLLLAERVCVGEGLGKGGSVPELELSLLFCDDPFMAELNGTYRNKQGPTDVLSFGQEAAGHHGIRVLGDVVISLETVERVCGGDRGAMREEIRLLFCHGLLHLLGLDHEGARGRGEMAAKQARYMGVDIESAWDHVLKGRARVKA